MLLVPSVNDKICFIMASTFELYDLFNLIKSVLCWSSGGGKLNVPVENLRSSLANSSCKADCDGLLLPRVILCQLLEPNIVLQIGHDLWDINQWEKHSDAIVSSYHFISNLTLTKQVATLRQSPKLKFSLAYNTCVLLISFPAP